MDETIKILRERAILCAHLPELRKIEATIRDLNKNEQRAEDFLKQVGATSFAEYIAAQDKNIQRDVAEKLLKKTGDAQIRLANQVAQVKLLLKHGRNYVEFNMNILARTSASSTYGAEAQTGSNRTRRMFEANI